MWRTHVALWVNGSFRPSAVPQNLISLDRMRRYSLDVTPFRLLVVGPLVLQVLWAGLWIAVSVYLWYAECQGKEGSCSYAALIPSVMWMYGQILLLPLTLLCLLIFALVWWRRTTRSAGEE